MGNIRIAFSEGGTCGWDRSSPELSYCCIYGAVESGHPLLYTSFLYAGSTPDSNYNSRLSVASSHGLDSCGNRGNSDDVVEC